MPYPQKMSNFPLMRRLGKILFHNAILVYAGSLPLGLPLGLPHCQRPLALTVRGCYLLCAKNQALEWAAMRDGTMTVIWYWSKMPQ